MIEQPLVVRHLPPALEGLRVAVLADIHASPVNDARYVKTIVDRTMSAAPDLIVLPGDLVDGDAASGRAHVAPLARLSARYGVWAAPGNHEYYSGYNSWMAEFRNLGLNLLENRMQVINIKGSKLALSGVGDPVYGRTSPNNANPNVPEGIPPMWMPWPSRPARQARSFIFCWRINPSSLVSMRRRA
ncbi:metallophosphoesterase [Comamonas sp. 26]|uniref:metallophosphoesterase n=1 Tax=Comamonas sp. 26 TaxID=2035201 RepID=UPI000C556A4A|nr:metallophosphoesterase [Comamonas sp. 26]PIG09250.1 calcineurin-like phosphoesterase family protein [Comamonas sp. 26]